MKIFLQWFLLIIITFSFSHCYLDEQNENKKDTKSPSDSSSLTPETAFLDPDISIEYIKLLAEKYPIAQYQNLGLSSDENYSLAKLIISDNVSTEEVEPEVIIIGGIHGDEVSGAYLALKLAEYLCTSYTSDSKVKKIVDSTEIHIIPVMNPWGLKNDFRNNANHVDLNRNFGWAWIKGTYHGEAPFDQIESQIVREDALANNYNLNLTFHSGETCISTVWDYIGSFESEGNPSNYEYETFLTEYLPNAGTILQYADQYATDVVLAGDEYFYATEGYDWYSVYGSIGDWFYGERGAIAYTIELSNYKSYSSFYDIEETQWYTNLTSNVWNYHQKALINLFSIFDNTISGTVKNAESGLPLNVKITFVKETRSAKDPVSYTLFTYSDESAGDFHMLCDNGSYTVTIEAEGYETYSINGIQRGSSLHEILLTPVLN